MVCEAIHINNILLPSETLIYHVGWFLNRIEKATVRSCKPVSVGAAEMQPVICAEY